jgi:hypothetical protein
MAWFRGLAEVIRANILLNVLGHVLPKVVTLNKIKSTPCTKMAGTRGIVIQLKKSCI